MKIITETERLIIRHYKEDDFAAFLDMNSNEEVMRYFPKCLDEQGSREFFTKINTRIKESGKCFWAIELKENNEFIGFVGLSEPNFEEEFIPCTEIGWRLRRKYWGRGYATEGAKACLEVGWKYYNLDEILAFAVKENIPSLNVMKKIGMHYVKNFMHPQLNESPEIQECVLYKMENPYR